MKYKWLNKKHNNKLIAFFNGWGMDESIITHLDCENFDVIMFYDYNTLDCNLQFDIVNGYIEKYLISWSMGVMIASSFASLLNPIKKSVAINGTLKPIDIDFGIHPKIYDLTIKGFNEQSCKKFIDSMFSNKNDAINIKNSRNFENLHTELVAIKSFKSNEDFKYNKVLISNDDKIIPTKSQVKFWQIEPNVNAGHCPFFLYKKWSELL